MAMGERGDLFSKVDIFSPHEWWAENGRLEANMEDYMPAKGTGICVASLQGCAAYVA